MLPEVVNCLLQYCETHVQIPGSPESENAKTFSHSLFRFGTRTLQLREEIADISRLTAAIIFSSLSDVLLQFGILKIEVIFKLVSAHDPGNRNPILLKNEVFPMNVDTPNDLPQVDSSSC